MSSVEDHSSAAAAAAEPEPPALPPPLPNEPTIHEQEGFTPVYMDVAPAAAAAEAAKRKSSDSGSTAPPRFYAVRSGVNVNNCLFFRWEDAEPEVSVAQGIDRPPIEYESFDEIDEAWEYLSEAQPNVGRPPPKKKSRKSFPASSVYDATGKEASKLKLWDMQYQELVNYKARHGHCLVPCGKKEETKLSRWVSRQRLEYRYFREGKPTAMTQERVDKLNEIGFAFRAWDAKRIASMTGAPGGGSANHGMSHEQIVAAAAAPFMPGGAAEKGIVPVPTAAIPAATVFLTKDEKYNQHFNEQYQNLLQYKAENGHADVSGNHAVLGRWVQQMRQLCKKRQEGKSSDPLTEEQYDKLMDMGFVMKARRGPKGGRRKENDDDSAAGWETMYNQLREFKEKNGHTSVPQNPYTPLRGWVLKQRNEYKRLRNNETSNLTARRLQLLNDLGLEWNNKKTLKWAERFEQLKRFKTIHGHCIVPRNYDENDCTGLGKWVAQQRHAYKLMNDNKSTTMTAERAKMFNDLGMVWSILKQPETRAERLPWEERFKQLLQYKEQFGHTVVPQHYPGGLGNWVHQQRTHYVYMRTGRKSLMNEQKAQKLHDIGFVFQVKKGKTFDPASFNDVALSVARAEKAGAIKKSEAGGYVPTAAPMPAIETEDANAAAAAAVAAAAVPDDEDEMLAEQSQYV